jgi:hypothetical protein
MWVGYVHTYVNTHRKYKFHGEKSLGAESRASMDISARDNVVLETVTGPFKYFQRSPSSYEYGELAAAAAAAAAAARRRRRSCRGRMAGWTHATSKLQT